MVTFELRTDKKLCVANTCGLRYLLGRGDTDSTINNKNIKYLRGKFDIISLFMVWLHKHNTQQIR